ncbi:hypothetical protein N5J23_01785 [Comamonas aquatica]|uniref:FimV N-terminal domain-containing protein n=1 Tax=Comamonas aquatica TaxID=225991 RepID=A0AA42W168_9BURK|nr:FimV/HubP family polar landmark protein [Comamonas aquatica]MDH1427599.1 hypothetical protein [Comamonas aquatica]MDH1604554.1 hypothetical protein [Comamonas aquatica]MDH1616556.1 hypothetical protein [Comamonas aquatica]MDH2004294.1 hypothetical protein [Comamonas aquatica]
MHRWKLSALAAAAFVSVALAPTDAAALALGPIRIQSALGENLRAEIAIPQITAAEMNSLSVQIAAPEVFRAQGMDYSSAARSVQVSLQRNPDGTASLRLSSNTPINEPFVDLVIDSQWSTGNLVRTYTLLLDPPASQRRAAPAPTPAQVTPPVAVAPAATPSPAPRPRAAAPTPAAAAPAATEPRNDSQRVQAGDTAGRLANANRPNGVSLDQMLVAMLRSNPKAFINGNVNRIRAGAVVQIPSREQALETSASEARQIVAAQSRDFNTYRRSLASKAPQATVQAADRSSGGQVQAHVEDASAAAATPDKLTLSKGAVQSAAAEEKMAIQKQAEDQSSRLNELQRNLAELNELAQNNTAAKPAAPATAAAPAAGEQPASTTATPGVEVAASNPAITAAAPEAPPASGDKAPEATPPAASDAPPPQAAAQPAPKPAVVPAAPVAETSLSDELLDNPLVPAGGAAVALLLGLLGYTAWKRRRAQSKSEDPALGDSQLQPDSFFGGSGGQQVDTSNAEGSATTMAYSPSQLDGGGDVDPVAEADVYLAYGRDVQAEEILKEALRNQPERLSIHLKLAEIYVKRHDIKALENTARGMQPVSQPQDPEWQRVVEMGRSLDPTNTFFAGADTGASATGSKPASSFAAALNAAKPELATPTAAAAGAVAAAAAAQTPDLPEVPDLDLHLDLPEGLITANTPAVADVPATQPPSDDDFAALELPSPLDSQLDVTAPPAVEDPPTLVQDTVIGEDSRQGLDGLDLDLSGFDVPAPVADTPPPAVQNAETDLGAGLDFDLDSPSPDTAAPASTAGEPAPAPAVPQDLEFDLGSLDLDLGTDAAPAAEPQAVHNAADDPLSTKLDLAQEFNSIGDSEGARALIEEVLAEASGPLKDRAQKMLYELD